MTALDVYDHITVYSVHKQSTQHGEVVSYCLQCERDYLFNPVAEACAENYKVQWEEPGNFITERDPHFFHDSNQPGPLTNGLK